jgi:hypothetical protein
MSPSPIGPGSWTRASTLAGRETGCEGTLPLGASARNLLNVRAP